MGNYIFKKIICQRDVRILSIGLDAAGKTTILYKLKLGDVVTTIPTIGFNVETITHNNVEITCWDVGLRDKMRPLLKHYLPGTDGLVFVIDSTDRERLNEALTELLAPVSKEDDIAGIPVLVLANKQDLKAPMTTDEITERIQTSGFLRGRPWTVFGTCALTGDGLNESLDWLTATITDGKKQHFFDQLENGANKTDKQNVTVSNEQTVETSDQTLAGKDQAKLAYLTSVVDYLKSLLVWK